MFKAIFPLLVLWTLAFPVLALQPDGKFLTIGTFRCDVFTEGYDQSTFDAERGGFDGPEAFREVARWVDGFMTGTNMHRADGKLDAFGNGSAEDVPQVYAWLADWCRDKPNVLLVYALQALMDARE